MPKATQTASRRRARSATAIRRFLVLDALRSWVVPAGVAGGAFVLWVLYNVDLVAPAPSVTIGGGLILFTALYAGLRVFFDEHTTLARAAIVAVFAVAWFLLTFVPFYRVVNPPAPLVSSRLQAHSPPVSVPLHNVAGEYKVVLEAHFLPANGQISRAVHYRLRVGHGTTTDQIVEGDFTESWRQQRIGRRGVAPVRVVQTAAQHLVESPTGEDLTLALDDLSQGAGDSVAVEVYSDAFPTNLLVLLGAVLTAAALVIDVWRDVDPEGLMTSVTLAALLGVGTFRRFAAPHPGFGDLIVNGALGTVAGAIGGAVLWRLTRARLRRLV